jgi:hypothetical protein
VVVEWAVVRVLDPLRELLRRAVRYTNFGKELAAEVEVADLIV